MYFLFFLFAILFSLLLPFLHMSLPVVFPFLVFSSTLFPALISIWSVFTIFFIFPFFVLFSPFVCAFRLSFLLYFHTACLHFPFFEFLSHFFFCSPFSVPRIRISTPCSISSVLPTTFLLLFPLFFQFLSYPLLYFPFSLLICIPISFFSISSVLHTTFPLLFPLFFSSFLSPRLLPLSTRSLIPLSLL